MNEGIKESQETDLRLKLLRGLFDQGREGVRERWFDCEGRSMDYLSGEAGKGTIR